MRQQRLKFISLPDYVPNQTYHGHTVVFEKHVPAKAGAKTTPARSA